MIVCVFDETNEDPFQLVCSYLTSDFGATCIPAKDISSVPTLKPQVLITNSINAIGLSKLQRTIYYATSSKIFGEPNSSLRRQIQVRPEVEYLAASAYLARLMYKNYQIKPRIQYPYIQQQEVSDPLCILYNVEHHIINELRETLGEYFRLYEKLEDFSVAKLYIHIPAEEEAVNIRLPVAASWGVPCVFSEGGCLSEMSSPGDTMIANNQWLQGVKIAMRDRDKNSQKSKEASKRFSNLDALVEKMKIFAQKRAIKKAPPQDQAALREKIILERQNMAAQKKKVQKVHDQSPYVINNIRQPYQPPAVKEIETTEFSRPNLKPDVSIIIPLYRSFNEIAHQIKSWDTSDDGLTKEIIYVDDKCPQESHNSAIASWSSRSIKPVARMLLLSNNSGFSTACNEGANYAQGKYVLFLNADTTVTPNWIAPMYHLMENNDKIGITGNLQLKDGDYIDSAGSEWMWDNKTFEHIGRNVYNGKRLHKMMKLEDAPLDLLEVNERDMVTGCCLMMKKSLFDEIGGFDVQYRVAYWEDSDINMQVKSRGYKVFYQPNSRIYHKTNHSRAGLHPFIMDNARLFYERWVNNFRIDDLVKNKRAR